MEYSTLWFATHNHDYKALHSATSNDNFRLFLLEVGTFFTFVFVHYFVAFFGAFKEVSYSTVLIFLVVFLPFMLS